jgi:hypothetical protein
MLEIREYQKKVVKVDDKKTTTTTTTTTTNEKMEPVNEKKCLEKQEENVPSKNENKIKRCKFVYLYIL